VVEQAGRALTLQEAKPRALVEVLNLLAERSPALAEIAAACLERAIALGLEGVGGAERVALLEALLARRSAAGQGVQHATVRRALEGLGDGRKKTRTADLARQLLLLQPAAGAPSSEALLRAHEVRVALRQVLRQG